MKRNVLVHLPLFLSTFAGALALQAGCVAGADSSSAGKDFLGGGDASDETVNEDASTPSDAGKLDGAKTKSDGGVPPPPGPLPDGGTLPGGAQGYAFAVDQISVNDPIAKAHRDSYINANGTKTLSGITVFQPDPDLFYEDEIQLKTTINGGGNGYLAVGSYPCATNDNSGAKNIPFGQAYLSILQYGGGNIASYQGEDGTCAVNVTSSAPIVSGGKMRITGTISGNLMRGATKFPVKGSFDLVYDN